MPIYEYQCLECGNRSEALQKMADPPLTTCEACGGQLKRLISSPAVQFKGSGWYVTDYARRGGGKGDGKGASGDAKGESKGDSKGESKSEPTSEGRSESKADTGGGGAKGEKPAAAAGSGSSGGGGSAKGD